MWRRESRSPGTKLKPKIVEFGALIGPSGQNQLYHTPLLFKILDLTENKKIVNNPFNDDHWPGEATSCPTQPALHSDWEPEDRLSTVEGHEEFFPRYQKDLGQYDHHGNQGFIALGLWWWNESYDDYWSLWRNNGEDDDSRAPRRAVWPADLIPPRPKTTLYNSLALPLLSSSGTTVHCYFGRQTTNTALMHL